MISVTVLTKNSGRTLKKTLESLRPFPQVILLDTGSCDDTFAIAKEFTNVSLHQTSFTGFGPLHNQAASLATHPWILSIDSDEVISPLLAQEILSLSLDPSHVYALRRHNFFHGKRVKYCSGWNCNIICRLYHKEATAFTEDLVHEKVDLKKLSKVILKHPIEHTPYLEISDFLKKMELYTTLFAEQYLGPSPSVLSPFFHGMGAFLKSYILKKGILGGSTGYMISLYQGQTAFYKYLKVRERDQHKRASR